MLSALRNFFDQRIAARPDESADKAAERARLAAAALLVELVTTDAEFTSEERAAVLGSLQRSFGLDLAAAGELVALAEAEAREAHDTWQFTASVNAGFSLEQKRGLVEELWRVAYADDALHRHEEHLIRRVADLLHLGHAEFIRAKLRVQAEASLKSSANRAAPSAT
jgi:uncharacterized tellurite resistance protein B-like protein